MGDKCDHLKDALNRILDVLMGVPGLEGFMDAYSLGLFMDVYGKDFVIDIMVTELETKGELYHVIKETLTQT